MRTKSLKTLNEELTVASRAVLDGFNLGRYQAIVFEGEDPDDEYYYDPVERLGAALAALKEKKK